MNYNNNAKMLAPEKEIFIEEIQYLRGLAILGVISIHTTFHYQQIENFGYVKMLIMLINRFSQYAVPLFIFVSGFVLFLRYNNTNFPIKNFYVKRAMSILPPYFLFSIFYILFSGISFNPFNIKLVKPIMFFIKLLAFSGGYHLWFLGLILQLYILYPLILRVYLRTRTNTWILLVVTLIIQVFWYIIYPIIADKIPDYNWVIVRLSKLLFLTNIFYFVLGMYLSDKLGELKSQFTKKKIAALIFIILLLNSFDMVTYCATIEFCKYYSISSMSQVIKILNYFFFDASLYTFIILLFFAFSNIISKQKVFISRFIFTLGKYSFGIYLIHAAILRIFVDLFPVIGINYNNLLFYMMTFILTVTISLIFTKLLSILPYSRFLIGR